MPSNQSKPNTTPEHDLNSAAVSGCNLETPTLHCRWRQWSIQLHLAHEQSRRKYLGSISAGHNRKTWPTAACLTTNALNRKTGDITLSVGRALLSPPTPSSGAQEHPLLPAQVPTQLGWVSLGGGCYTVGDQAKPSCPCLIQKERLQHLASLAPRSFIDPLGVASIMLGPGNPTTDKARFLPS